MPAPALQPKHRRRLGVLGGVLDVIDADRFTWSRPGDERPIGLLHHQSGPTVVVAGLPDEEVAMFGFSHVSAAQTGPPTPSPPPGLRPGCGRDSLGRPMSHATEPDRLPQAVPPIGGGVGGRHGQPTKHPACNRGHWVGNAPRWFQFDHLASSLRMLRKASLAANGAKCSRTGETGQCGTGDSDPSDPCPPKDRTY